MDGISTHQDPNILSILFIMSLNPKRPSPPRQLRSWVPACAGMTGDTAREGRKGRREPSHEERTR